MMTLKWGVFSGSVAIVVALGAALTIADDSLCIQSYPDVFKIEVDAGVDAADGDYQEFTLDVLDNDDIDPGVTPNIRSVKLDSSCPGTAFVRDNKLIARIPKAMTDDPEAPKAWIYKVTTVWSTDVASSPVTSLITQRILSDRPGAE